MQNTVGIELYHEVRTVDSVESTTSYAATPLTTNHVVLTSNYPLIVEINMGYSSIMQTNSLQHPKNLSTERKCEGDAKQAASPIDVIMVNSIPSATCRAFGQQVEYLYPWTKEGIVT